MPIFLLYAAGAGFVAGGWQLISEANRRRASEELRHRQEVEAEVLAAEIDLAKLRKQAIDAGVDPSAVMDGLDALRRGDLTLDKLQRLLSIA